MPRTCTKQFTLHVEPADFTCPVFAGTFVTLAGQQICVVSRDAAISRVFLANSGNIYNGVTGAFVATAVGSNPNPGGIWIPTTQKFCSRGGNAPPNIHYSIVNALTGAVNNVGDETDNSGIPCYDASDDSLHSFGLNFGTAELFYTKLDCATETVITKTSLGIQAGASQTVLCPSPNHLMANGPSGPNTLTRFSFPVVGLGPVIDLGVPPYFTYRRGMAFHPADNGFWVSAERDPDSRELALRIDPATFTITDTVVLPDVNTGGTVFMSVGSGNRLYVEGTNNLIVIDVVTRAIICTVPLGANTSGFGYCTFTERVFTVDLATGNLRYYE